MLDLNNINEEEAAQEEEEEAPATTDETVQIDTNADTQAAETQVVGKKRGRGRRGTGGNPAMANKKVKAVKQVQNYMWAFLSENYRGRVRAACLQFVSVFINKMP